MRPVFVGNFGYDTRSKDLDRLFSKYGRVDRVDVKSGYAFVYFDDERDAEYAIRALDNSPFGYDRRKLSVEWARGERGRGRDAPKGPTERPTKTLFVINFDPIRTQVQDLERHFDPYGKLRSVRIRKNYGFVEFENLDDAIKALECTHRSKVLDNVISVEYARRADDEKDGRGGGLGRGYGRSPYRRSPSPHYGRSRPSPDYGRSRPSPDYGRSRPSPDYGRSRPSPDYGRNRPSPDYGRPRSPIYDRPRSPINGRTRSPIYDRPRSPINGRTRSPIYDRPRSPINGRTRSPIYDRPRSPINGRTRSPIYDRPRSPINGRTRSPIYDRLHTRSPISGRPRTRSPSNGRPRSPMYIRPHNPVYDYDGPPYDRQRSPVYDQIRSRSPIRRSRT